MNFLMAGLLALYARVPHVPSGPSEPMFSPLQGPTPFQLAYAVASAPSVHVHTLRHC